MKTLCKPNNVKETVTKADPVFKNAMAGRLYAFGLPLPLCIYACPDKSGYEGCPDH